MKSVNTPTCEEHYGHSDSKEHIMSDTTAWLALTTLILMDGFRSAESFGNETGGRGTALTVDNFVIR